MNREDTHQIDGVRARAARRWYRKRRARARITERIRSLRETNDLLVRVIDGTSDILYAKDLQHRYLVCNQAAADALQRRKEDVIGRDDATLFSLEHASSYMDNERALIANGAPWVIVDERLTVHGEERIVSSNKGIFRDADGEVAGIIGISRDITDMRRSEADLRRAKEAAEAGERARSEFVASISHEIRTPMNGMLGMADLLDATPLSAEQREMTSVMRRSGAHLLVIIDDILEFSKLESGQVHLHVTGFELPRIVRDVVALLEVEAHRKGIRLEAEVDPLLRGTLRGDVDRIRQVLVNLLGNAIKFTERGGVRLVVKRMRWTETETRFRVAVYDSGIGVARAAQTQQLFQPFHQVDHGDRRRFGGTGLGLAICARIAQAMGSRIRMRSAERRGSVFWFTLTLPNLGLGTSSQPESEIPASHPAYRNLHVLLAEDDEANQLVARMMLEHAGHTVRIVENGAEALVALRDEPFDCVLMDCQMPLLDGYEAVRRLRGNVAGPLNATVPVVALTASGMPGDRERCLVAGMNEFVLKPLTRRKLAEALQRCKLMFDPRGPSSRPR